MAMRSKEKKENNQKIAVLGYGSQGRAIAQNLSDSGANIVVGLKGRSRSHKKARDDKLISVTPIEAVCDREIIIIATPDQTHATLFSKRLGDAISRNKPTPTIIFLHGLTVHFDLVSLPDRADITLLAPHAPGLAVREKFVSGEKSISAFYAVSRDHSKQAQKRLFWIAEMIGFSSDRLLKTSFEHEAIGDIFGEQAVLCGGLAMLIKNGFEVLVEHGLKPDHAYLEVAYQLDLIIKLIKEHGIEGMLKRVSVAARLGAVQNGPKIIGPEVKTRMNRLYQEISSGKFPRQLANLTASELRKLNRSLHTLTDPRFEKAARKHK